MKKKIFIISIVLFLASPVMAEETENMIYQCDYTKDSYHIILSSGSGLNPSEVWGVDKDDYKSLPNIKLTEVEIYKIVNRAKKHLENRFANYKFKLSQIDYRKINNEDLENPNNWYILLYFKNGESSFELIPVLLDGRIILSRNEK